MESDETLSDDEMETMGSGGMSQETGDADADDTDADADDADADADADDPS